MIVRPIGIGESEGMLVRWSPETPVNTRLAIPQALPATGNYRLHFATPQGAMLTTFPDRDLSRDYVLLGSAFLYNIADTQFHELTPDLPRTTLPVPLAPAAPAPLAAYL